MFEGLRGKTNGSINEDHEEKYNESVEVSDNSNEEENNSDYQICIQTKNNEFYVDDCKENWDILMNLNNKTEEFIYLKDTTERDNGILGIRVSKIIAFYPEED